MNIPKEKPKQMPKYLKNLISKQCEFGFIEYDDINFDSDTWYAEHTVTEQQQQMFREWMIQTLRDSKIARENIMGYPSRKYKDVKKTVDAFILGYGFKTK